MALTKEQVSLVTVATLGVAAGGYTAQLAAFNTQKEAAAFIATTGLLNEGTNAEYALQVVKNLGSGNATTLFNKLEAGASRADATVDFANAQLVAQGGSIAQVNKAIASTSTSADLAVLKAELSDPAPDGLRVEFKDTNTDQSSSVKVGHTVNNIGKAQIDAGAGKISKDFTFALKNQIGEDATFTGNFLSPILDQAPEKTSGSTIVVELRNLRQSKDSETPLKDLPTNGFGFTLNGELVSIVSDGIFAAETYAELEEAVRARVEELGRGENLPRVKDADGNFVKDANDEYVTEDPALYAKLATFEVTLGALKPAEERENGEVVVTHDREVRPIILKDTSDDAATLVPAGWSYEANPTVGGGGYTFFGQMTDAEGQSSQFKIETNLEANNVGYGSQGATVNLVGQSASDKGIEQLNVNTTNNAWFTKLESQKGSGIDHLEIVNVNGDGYFRVGTQKNDPNHLVALVDEDFDNAGLVDVQQLNAGSLAGDVAVNSHITDAVIKRFDLKDIDADHLKDNKDALIQYNLTGGNDVLQIKIDSEVVAYADAVVNINAGAGNDFVHLQIDQDNSYGTTWLTNQQLNDNINIKAIGGSNIIWTEGAGNANIETGSGADTIYVDNSGKQTVGGNSADKLADLGYGDKMNALFALNAASADLGDIVSNTDNGLDNNGTNVAQVYNTFKNKVSVEFKGFETTHVEIESTNYTTSTQQVNQAIKKAILEDATLSKLLTVKEFPGNVLVVESLIDGEMLLSDLSFDFVAPADNGTAAALLTKGQLVLGANDLKEAAKAYDEPGKAAPTIVAIADLNFSNNAAGIEAIYNTNKAFVTEGPGSTAEVQKIDFNAVTAALIAGDAGTIQVGSVNIALETGDDANDIASKVAAQLNGKMQNGDLGVALVGTAADAAVTATASNGVVTITYATTAGNVALVGNTASVAPSTAAAALAITAGETATGVATTTAEVQTITQAQIAAFKAAVTKGSVTMVIGQQEVVINATDTVDQIGAKLAAALNGKDAEADLGLTAGTTDGAVTAIYTPTVDLVVTFDIASGTMTNLATTTPVVSGTQAVNIVGITSSLVLGGAIVDADLDGIDSTAHSDNVVNAGAGNDVIVLGTDDESNDTVVLTDNFVKTTIVNFDSTTAAADAAGNGGDLLDFTAYLNSNYGAAGQGNVTLTTSTTLNTGNTVSVVDFSDLTSTTTGGLVLADDELTASINTTKLALELNAEFTVSTTAATNKHVFLIHKDSTTVNGNDGEYVVVTATSTATDAKLTGVKVVGTLDFGDAANFTGDFTGNILGFDGVIV